MSIHIILGSVISYFLGSVPFSYIIAKIVKGVDLRVVGEGNVGGRNVWHVVGKKYGIIAGLLDLSKGLVAYFVGLLLGLSPWWIWLCGFFVVLGHCFPIFLRFKGGKGIACTLGFLTGMQPLIILISIAIFGFIYLPSRNFHLAISPGLGSIPILWWVIGKKSLWEIVLLISLLLLMAFKRIIDEPHMKRIKQESAGW